MFKYELKAFEEAMQMKFVTSIERMAKENERLATQTEIALNLLRQGLEIESIAQATGLTITEIQTLQV
jgi:predicted transposase YdaD